MFENDDDICEDNIETQIWFLIKRLRQPYTELICMPTNYRLQLWKVEKKLEAAETNNNNLLPQGLR